MIRVQTIKTIHMLLAALLLSAVAPAVLADQYYKWVDDDGVTHYGSEPPEVSTSESVKTYGPSSDQEKAIGALEKQRDATRRARQNADQKTAEAERAKQEPETVSRERCDQHRKNLKALQDRPVVRVKNPQTGKMEVIDQERRERMIETTRAALEDCD